MNYDHGETCPCGPCGTIRHQLHQGQEDVAVNVAYRRGIINKHDFEAAYRTGIDVLRLAGFGTPPSTSEQAAIDAVDIDPDHELRAALAEVRRLRDGIAAIRRWRVPGTAAYLQLGELLEPVDLTVVVDGPEAA